MGNRKQLTSGLSMFPNASYSYDANDRLTTDTIDSNGNTTLSGTVSSLYDFENHMTSSGPATIVYDGDGNRVSETVGGATTKYLVDTVNPTGLPQVVDETVNGAVTRTYAYGLQRISENQLAGSTWTPSFYGYDGHGNVRFLTSSAHSVTDTYQYDAFGRIIAVTGSTPNNFKYSGEWLDSNVGLFYLRARYLNPATGRFWARDPVEGKFCCGMSWNPYIYVKDNPVNALDPTGRSALIEGVYVDLGRPLTSVRTLAWYACAVEFSWALSADTVNLVTRPFLGEDTVPEPPLPLTVVCGWVAIGTGTE